MPTRCAGDGIELAHQAALKGFDVVLACGGDGTFSQVVMGCRDTGVPAGLIPAGTGNDFARMIDLPREPRAAANALVNGHPKSVDLLEVNNGEVWSVNMVGIGFDARVAERTNRRVRWIGGRTAYMLAIALELIHHRCARMRVRIDDNEWEGEALLLAVANTRSYGGGMIVAPDAEIDDGMADVVLIERLSRIQFIRSFPLVLKGTHVHLPQVHQWRGREITVLSDDTQPALVDGDVVAHTPITVRISPGRALVWIPG
jgi:diacylglycerol kinase (ATP)